MRGEVRGKTSGEHRAAARIVEDGCVVSTYARIPFASLKRTLFCCCVSAPLDSLGVFDPLLDPLAVPSSPAPAAPSFDPFVSASGGRSGSASPLKRWRYAW